MSFRDELLKATKIKESGLLSESLVYNKREFAPTQIPMMNVALSADPFGGVSSGLTAWCGPSKHFKSLFCLVSAKAYLDKHDDATLLFYDSEFGTPPSYFMAAGIDPTRVIHAPITNYEELTFDINRKLELIKTENHVIIVVDSLGNLASKKEATDALSENSAADMTRAKVNKSLFRVITPKLKLKDIPMHVVQHVYDTMEMYSKKVVSGGQGTMLSADNVFIIGRQQEKDTVDTKKLSGYNFIINIEKSRYVKEKMKIPISVSFNGGIKRWSGILDLAVEGGYIEKVTSQSYSKINTTTGEIEPEKFKRKDIEYNSTLWKSIFAETDFAEFIKTKFAVAHGALINDDDEDDIDDIIDDEEDEIE